MGTKCSDQSLRFCGNEQNRRNDSKGVGGGLQLVAVRKSSHRQLKTTSVSGVPLCTVYINCVRYTFMLLLRHRHRLVLGKIASSEKVLGCEEVIPVDYRRGLRTVPVVVLRTDYVRKLTCFELVK
jgi:hypothetical protein